MSSRIKEIFKGIDHEEMEYILNYKYKGLTIDQWDQEVEKAQGVDKNGDPVWMEKLADLQYGLSLARTMFIYKKEILDAK